MRGRRAVTPEQSDQLPETQPGEELHHRTVFLAYGGLRAVKHHERPHMGFRNDSGQGVLMKA